MVRKRHQCKYCSFNPINQRHQWSTIVVRDIEHRQSTKSRKSLFPLLMRIVFICGLTYQLVDFTKIYLAYDVSTMISLQAPVDMAIPGLTICLPYAKMAEFDKIQHLKTKVK